MNVIIAADFLTFSKQMSFPPSSIIFYLINGCLSNVIPTFTLDAFLFLFKQMFWLSLPTKLTVIFTNILVGRYN